MPCRVAAPNWSRPSKPIDPVRGLGLVTHPPFISGEGNGSGYETNQRESTVYCGAKPNPVCGLYWLLPSVVYQHVHVTDEHIRVYY